MLRRPAFRLLALLLLALCAYGNSFAVPLQFDDRLYLQKQPSAAAGPGERVQHPCPNLADFDLLLQGRREAIAPELRQHPYFVSRWLGYASLWLQWRSCGVEVTAYHVVNFAIHLANAVLVWLLVRCWWAQKRLQDAPLRPQAEAMALLAAALFVAHPLATEAVTYIAQRFVQQATFFYLGTVVAWLAANAAQGSRRTGLQVLAVAAAAMAMLTKEIAATLPVTLGLLEAVLGEGPSWQRLRRWLPFAALLLLVPLAHAGGDGLLRFQTDTPRWHYLLTQCVVVPGYLRLWLLPSGQNANWDVPVRSSPGDAAVLGGAGLLLLLAGAAAVGLRQRARPWLQFAGFGGAWFFVTLAVESSVVPFSQRMVEYRVYLPSVGLAVVAAALVAKAAGRWRQWWAVAVALPVLLSVLAALRNQVWQDEVTFWQDVVAKSPASARGHLNLGNAHSARGETAAAIGCFQRVLQLDPDDVMARNNLANALQATGDFAAAADQYRQLLTRGLEGGMAAELHYNLAVSLHQAGQLEQAKGHYREALRLQPANPEAQSNLGVLLLALGQPDEAIACLRQALQLDAGATHAWFNLGVAAEQKGDSEAAVRSYQTFLQHQPTHVEAHRRLAAQLRKLGRTEAAAQAEQQAAALEAKGR